MEKTSWRMITRKIGQVLVAAVLMACERKLEIPYPQPPADTVAISFLPGVVSDDHRDFGSAFSPDGKSFYFARSGDGPSRILVTHYDQGWSEPEPLFADATYSDADPAFAPDGTLYFISNRPKDPSDSIPDYDIWSVSPLWSGGWNEPQNVAVLNSDSAEYYVSFSASGNLYFASNRKGGFGQEDIYVSFFENEQLSTPQNLGGGVNTSNSEYDPMISSNEDFLVFASSGRESSYGGADLYAAKRDGDLWNSVRNIGNDFNTSGREFCPYITPDSRYFFFSSQNDVKWVRIEVLLKQVQ